jgi:hypothetical protein
MSSLDPAAFIGHHCYGVLSSHSLSHPGYPFGSVVPYVISPQGQIAIYISELAEHTKNIQADNKVALTITDIENENSPGSGARITCLAEAVRSNEQQALSLLYQQRFSDAEIILQLPGFQFYQLNLQAVRLIAGFGDIQWLNPEQLTLI